jgi:hypothetical protein
MQLTGQWQLKRVIKQTEIAQRIFQYGRRSLKRALFFKTPWT